MNELPPDIQAAPAGPVCEIWTARPLGDDRPLPPSCRHLSCWSIATRVLLPVEEPRHEDEPLELEMDPS